MGGGYPGHDNGGISFKDIVTVLNSALEKIISDRELRQATARNARVWANDYTYEKRVKSIIEVLKLNISK